MNRQGGGFGMRYTNRRTGFARLAILICVSVAPGQCGGGADLSGSRHFDVVGNQRVDDASVLVFAGIEPGQTVSAGQVNDARQRIQGSGLFETVEVIPQGSTTAHRGAGIPDDQRDRDRGQPADR